MPRRPSSAVDPVFSEIAKAIYGDIDVRELVKAAPGSPDVHVDKPVGTSPASQAERKAKTERKLALTGLGASGVATFSSLHAVNATRAENRTRIKDITGEEPKPMFKRPGWLPAKKIKAIKKPASARLAGKLHIKPVVAASAIGAGMLGLHGVDVVGDTLNARAQMKALKAANKDIPAKSVSKSLRLRPLNTFPSRNPSLRARRPMRNPLPSNPTTKAGIYQPFGKALRVKKPPRLKALKAAADDYKPWSREVHDITYKPAPGTRSPEWYASALGLPPVSKGLRAAYRGVKEVASNVKATTGSAKEASRAAAETATKVKRLVPSPKVAAALGGAGLLGAGAMSAGGSYVGTYGGARRAQKKLVLVQPVAKSEVADVTWTGVIAKVDPDKRQVFGWASISAINGEEVIDLQGDIVPIEEVEKSAYRYVIESRKGGDMHKRVSKQDEPLHTADMIESFVVTPEKLEKMGLEPDALPHGWWVGYHVNDDAQWNMVKSGERKGFSIHGSGKRTAVSKAYTPHLERVARSGRVLDAKLSQWHAGGRAGKFPGREISRLAEAHHGDVRRAGHAGHTLDEIHGAVGGLKIAEPLGLASRAKFKGIVSPARSPLRGDAPEVAPPWGHGLKVAKGLREDMGAHKAKLKERTEQAVHPPAVKLRPVKSSAIAQMGYQPQTRRLAYAMQSRPDDPYVYRVKGQQAVDAMMAPSLGHHYATRIRNKTKHAEKYTPADRARLFIDPQEG